MDLLYPVCRSLQKLTLNTFSNFEVEGSENVPPMGPLIIVSNHMSNIDPSILSCSINRKLRFLAKDTLFRGFPLSQMLYAYGAYPIRRGRPDIQAIKWATHQIKNDAALVVFPEGTRNKGAMIKGKIGTARLIQMTQSTILPVGITGTEHLQHILRVVKPKGNIKVNIGTPFSLPTIDGEITRSLFESFTEIIMTRVANLLPRGYKGVYDV